MGGKSQPDFGDIATQQGEENREVVRDQIYANRPSQYTPFGYSKWTTETLPDGTESWSNTQGLTPELQEILNKQTAMQGARTDVAGNLTGRMANEFGQEMNWEGLNPMAETPMEQFTFMEGGMDDPYQTRQRAEDSVYNQAQSRIAPQQDAQRQGLEMKLRNQGLKPGDAAWQSQMQTQGQQFNDQNNQALWSANQAGRAESGQMYGQQLSSNQNRFNQALGSNQQNFNQQNTSANYANQIRQQQLTEQMQKRGFNLNEINALMYGQQVGMPNMPSFNQAQAAAPAPYMNAAAQNASGANAGNSTGGLMDLGGQLGSAAISTWG